VTKPISNAWAEALKASWDKWDKLVKGEYSMNIGLSPCAACRQAREIAISKDLWNECPHCLIELEGHGCGEPNSPWREFKRLYGISPAHGGLRTQARRMQLLIEKVCETYGIPSA
jgi:hypothetical protein